MMQFSLLSFVKCVVEKSSVFFLMKSNIDLHYRHFFLHLLSSENLVNLFIHLTKLHSPGRLFIICHAKITEEKGFEYPYLLSGNVTLSLFLEGNLKILIHRDYL